MQIRRILIANRGEVALRIARAAAELDLETLAVYSTDDERSRHRLAADRALALDGTGPAAYLDGTRLIALALENECQAIHPGYGFLSENADFAAACEDAGLIFVGPHPETLRLFGDKSAARRKAEELGLPLARGSTAPLTPDGARAFFRELTAGTPGAAAILKAVAGGGGRGMRIVRSADEIETAFARCASEARSAFGRDELYMEELLAPARHVEIQLVGDGSAVHHLGERECSLQRRHQKLIEIAPAPGLDSALRAELIAAALALGRAVEYRGLGTVEFLVRIDTTKTGARSPFVFMEANPRLQVEHTVTEAVTGVDLVQLQLRLAMGARLSELELSAGTSVPTRGYAMQLRVNAERIAADGQVLPADGRLEAFEPPAGPGLRVDTHGYTGYRLPPAFDSLLAKVIVATEADDFDRCLRRARRALREFRLSGVATNREFLLNVLEHPDFAADRLHVGFIEERMAALSTAVPQEASLHFAPDSGAALADARADSGADREPTGERPADLPAQALAIRAPMPGRLLEVKAVTGQAVAPGAELAIIEAMKMENAIQAERAGIVVRTAAVAGNEVAAGQVLLYFVPDESARAGDEPQDDASDDRIRSDLQQVLDRHWMNMDEARPRAVAKRHKRGQRTARENIEDLCDPGSFQEYGSLALAAQRRRRSMDELLKLSPADGLVAGTGRVNGALFDADQARAAVMAYDYTVFAGTQGAMNHKKTDRLLHVVEDLRLPFVLFAEGGGGRPGDVDVSVIAGLDLTTFRLYAGLSGLVPRVAVASGRCFAGNAALLGCSDIVIATEDATIGMGGPVMIKGGGLGNFRAEEVGPAAVQSQNGVIDLLVADEAAATRAAKQALGYFQGDLRAFDCADQNRLRRLVPENRLRAYDVREIIRTLADTGSVLELRQAFAPGMITAFVRVGGRGLGLIANNPVYQAGAIDADGADKAARFLQLCDAFDIPLVTLCDTPGIMVGPAAERTALVRHASRLFVTAASIDVPVFTIVLRKGYGLGAMAMAGGGFHATVFTVAWPTGEFGAMGLEGAVSTGFQKELAEIKDWRERQELFKKLVAEAHEHGKALNMASQLEIDDVIDPAESRRWILRGLDALPPRTARKGKKRPMVDVW